MILIRLTAPQRTTLLQALLDRYQNAAGVEEMLLKLNQRFQQISVEGQNLRQNLGTAITTAEAEGWLLALVKQVREDVPGDPRLQDLEDELAPQSLDAPKQQDSAGSAIYSPSTDVSVDSESTIQGSVAQGQNPNETDAIYKGLKVAPGNEVQLSRRQHQSISEMDNRQISDVLMPEEAKSHKSEGGLKVPEISVLPGAIEYHSSLSRILIELNTLYSIPEFPKRLTGKSVFKWQFLTTTWLAKAERVLTEATAIAAVRESGGYPSPRLARATADAKAGLAWIRKLVANNGKSSESSQFLRHCEETVSAISEVAAYAAGS